MARVARARWALLVVAAVAACCAQVSADQAHDLDDGAHDAHRLAVDAESCSAAKGYFIARNLSTPIPDSPVNGAGLQVCAAGRSCCTPAMEDALQRRVHRDFAALVHHNSRSTQDLLASSATGLREHLVRLARWSEGKTLTLFGQVYQRMAVLAREPIHQLYADIVRYLDTPTGTAGLAQGSPGGAPSLAQGADVAWLSSPPQSPSMTDSVNRFFAKLFPLTFHTTVAPAKRVGDPSRPQRQLEPTYERCLSSKMAEVQPFGDSPRSLAHSLGRALEAARVLLGVLRVGADVLNTTDSLLLDISGSPCPPLLLKLWTCPRCAGLDETVRPCQGYCLNVLRGCVLAPASELDQPWTEFVEAASKLAGSAAMAPAFPGRPRSAARSALYQLNAEEAIRQMENKISEAIMFAMENGPAVERKMKSACGPPKWVEVPVGESLPTPLPMPPSPRRVDGILGALLPDELSGPGGPLGSPASHASAVHFAKTLRELQESLLQSRTFYADLADVLCADEGFAAKNAQPCWNGQRVGEYTKTVVAASASAQRYNPELPWTTPAPGSSTGSTPSSTPRSAAIAQLVDRLRHLRYLVLSQLAEMSVVPESDSFVRDEEGYDGEGSGASGAPGPGHPGHPGHPSGGSEGGAPWSDDEDHWAEGSGHGSGDGNLPVETKPPWESSPETPVLRGGEEDRANKTSAAAHQSSCSVVLAVSVLTVMRLV